jgi:hypothetical protein
LECNAAGPAVEQIWQDFRAGGRFQVLEVDVWNGSLADVQGFANRNSLTFPVLQDGGYLQTAPYYGIERDNYIVIDVDGIVRYTSQDEPRLGTIGRFRDSTLRQTIRTWLPSAVDGWNWSAVKEIYR